MADPPVDSGPGDPDKQRPRERVEKARENTKQRVEQARERATERVETARERATEQVERARLTTRRLLGIDRSGPAPPETLHGHPLRPWTIPNAIGFVRLALIPVFLVLALGSEDGTGAPQFIVFAVIGASDYLDGFAARVTGQYSRLGAILDPFVDRLLVISAAVVCWEFDLLPRWALAVLAARELIMLAVAQSVLRHDIDLKINWIGRLGVWPTLGGLGLAIAGVRTLSEILFFIGLAMALVASVLYGRTVLTELRARKRATTPSS